MRKRSTWIPISFVLVVLVCIYLMAMTDLFLPLIRFIHSEGISVPQAIGCLLGGLIFFYICLKVLIALGHYFLPDSEE